MRSAIVMFVSVVTLLAAPAVWTQEADEPAAPADEALDRDTSDDATDETVEASNAETPVEIDERSYADTEEEDFVPSEDIPTDQAIAFPTDI